MNEAAYAQALLKLQRQIAAMREARILVEPLLPVDEQVFDPAALTPEQRMFLDAFRARFADLQDFLGQRIFRLIALWDEDESPARPLSTRERVQLMERKGFLERRQWHALRDLRNAFAHEYPDEHAVKAAHLNEAFRLAPTLETVAEALARYMSHALER